MTSAPNAMRYQPKGLKLCFLTKFIKNLIATKETIVRVYLLFKNSFVELKRIIHPNGIINVKYNNKSVHPNIMTGIMAFAILFMIVFTIGSLIMTIFTEDIITACSAVVSSMSNVGPGFGSVGPMFSYAHLNDFAKLFLAFLMLVGRLEIFTVMVLFTKAFWRK